MGVDKSGVTWYVQVLQSNPPSKCLEAVLNKIQLQRIVCACDNYNIYLILCILRRSRERDENQKIFPSLAAPVVMWVFLALPYFWGFLAVGYFRLWDIFGGEIFSEHLATHAKAWHVSAACLAPAQLKGGCLLPEGSACDEYLLNLLTYPTTS